MGSRSLLGLGLALCTAVSAATYFGTRVVLDELRAEDSGRQALIRSLEEKLAELERNDGALDRRLQAIALARSLPADSGGASNASAAGIVPPEEAENAPLPPPSFPGAVIDDPSLLSAVEQSFLERYPPGEGAILVRGSEGKLGYLRISSKRDGRRAFTVLDAANFGLVEELSTAIVDREGAIQTALVDLAAAGAGVDCATMEDAIRHGKELGGYYVLPVGERFRILASSEVERDRRVAMASAHLDGIKEDFGEYTSYVLNWVQPGLEAARDPSGSAIREGMHK